MTTLALQNFNTLVQSMAAAAQGASEQPLNLEEGSTILALMEAAAAQGLFLQYLTLQVLAVTRLATSFGTDCDSFGNDFGFTRLPAVSATGNVTFARFTNTISAFIPVYVPATSTTLASGTQILTSDGTTAFDVIADPTNAYYVTSPSEGYLIPSGTSSALIPVIADVPGAGGNVLANTITLIVSGIPGIDTATNLNATSGGVNAETDAAFKLRFVNFINSRTEGTADAVGYAIQQIQQGLTWTIQENQVANGTYTPGTFVVTIDDGSGDPPSGLIATATTAVQKVRPIGSFAIVQGPTKIAANISLILTLNPNISLQVVEAEVNAALVAFINALPVGATLPYNRIAQVVFDADSNITNISNVTLGGGTSDLTVTESQVVRAGSISVT